ncbi:PBSX family phage terminase large subunit [Weissella confusa]|uniref:PBSX family phage terminase large subunit n=1 Tax=Weissella confusa TaxID=1583 RepID=UPI00223BB391|nr:PBSX family phage terminase large subunit [Weissella confusa]
MKTMADMVKNPMFLTKKQIQTIGFLARDDWNMMINHGGVRAGKTFIDNLMFLYEIERVRKLANAQGIGTPMYIMSGATAKTIENNIIQPLGEVFGIYPTYDRFNNLYIRGVKIVLAYHGSISGLQSIRGMTAYGAYINEASLANPEVFSEILKRISAIDTARVLVDTNPDIPSHWLKTDYIDKAINSDSLRYTPAEKKRSHIIQNQFILDDNTSLSKKSRENIKALTPSGMLYDRAIYGRWVSGEGAVYADFDEEKHFINKEDLPEMDRYVAGVDWGYEHTGVIQVWGVKGEDYYLIEERAKRHAEIDYWVEVAKDVVDRYGDIPFWADSARPEHVARFANEDIDVRNADKRILKGIEDVAKLIKADKLHVVREDAPEFETEIFAYVWDEKKGVPVKDNDHAMDTMRYVIHNDKSTDNQIVVMEGIF